MSGFFSYVLQKDLFKALGESNKNELYEYIKNHIVYINIS